MTRPACAHAGRAALIAPLLIVAAVAGRLTAASAPSEPHEPPAGIVSLGAVLAAGVALSSGSWGTDYITVSHALAVGRSYAVIQDGQPYAETTPVAACSSQAHGIDVLILRAAAHIRRPVVKWGDPAELQRGDELTIYVRREFHPAPVKVKFIHSNLLAWTGARAEQVPRQWQNVMVGAGLAKPGFSGSPWVKDGKVYGLFKGSVQPPGQSTWYVVAETSIRARQCLEQVRYEDLVPRE